MASDAEPGELLRALRLADESFDPAWHAVRAVHQGNEYHTRLKRGTPAHPTRESADYALGLLDSGAAWRADRAYQMLRRLVEAQDADPASITYGLWPWYYEEPLAEMADPDFNWADFIGDRLVQILLRHGESLGRDDPALHAAARTALKHAAGQVRRRDVDLSYTNIAIMSTYVTVMAGELLADRGLLTYGRDRLRRLASFTDDYGGFPEYNSPTYICVSITVLSRMVRDFSAPDDGELARRLHDRAWQEAALRWHEPSGQWAGPHRRSYFTLLPRSGRGELDVLRRGLGDRADLGVELAPSLDRWTVPFRCPDTLTSHFTNQRPNRDLVALVSEDGARVAALTRLRPAYALGVASYGSLWAQGRPVVAHAMGPAGPVAFRVRLTYDGKDFAPGRVFTFVHNDTVAAGVCVAGDVGAAHPVLDTEWAGRVRAGEITLRLELLGVDPGDLPQRPELGSTKVIPFGASVSLGLRVIAAGFGQSVPAIETLTIDGGCAVDVVLYRGAERTMRLAEVGEFFAAFAFQLGEGADATLDQIAAHRQDGRLDLDLPDAAAAVSLPTTPRPAAELEAMASSSVARFAAAARQRAAT